MNQLSIRTRGLSKIFGNRYALNGVELDIEGAQVVMLLGPNGAGKSTLMSILATLTRPSKGKVQIGNLEHRQAAHHLRRKIGLLAHENFLYPELTVLENLLFYGRLYSLEKPAQRARKVLEDMGLWRRRNDRAAVLSRGMTRRLAFARVLMADPEYLLLDEPFSGLDQKSVGRLKQQMTSLSKAGKLLICITHDLGIAAELGDRFLILRQGRLRHDFKEGAGPNKLRELCESP